MDGELLTRAAERAGARYALLLEAFRGALDAASLLEPWSDRARSQLATRLYELANAWLEDQPELIAQDTTQHAELALRYTAEDLGVLASPPSAEIAAHVAELAEALENALRVQIERDIAGSLGSLREMSLRETIRARSRGVARTGASGVRHDTLARLRFDFLDRAGKRWPSQKHVRTLWRQTLVNVWNEAALLAMAEYGIAQAVIDHPDASHGENGTLLSLTESAEGLLWVDLREVFHPNTHAFVRAWQGSSP